MEARNRDGDVVVASEHDTIEEAQEALCSALAEVEIISATITKLKQEPTLREAVLDYGTLMYEAGIDPDDIDLECRRTVAWEVVDRMLPDAQ